MKITLNDIKKYEPVVIDLVTSLMDGPKKFSIVKYCDLQGLNNKLGRACVNLGYIQQEGSNKGVKYKSLLHPAEVEPIHIRRILEEMKRIQTVKKVGNTPISSQNPEISAKCQKAINTLKAEGYKITIFKTVSVDKTYTF